MRVILENVSKNFGSIEALKEVSFKISPGEFVFLTGPSGSGKTTVFKIILGEIVPEEGSVWVGDCVLFNEKKRASKREVADLRRKVGMIYQDFELIEEYTVKENVLLALEIMGVKEEDRERRLTRVLKKVDLLARKEAFPRQLSGGELQRVCLARALAIRPKLLLADEPTGNLDPRSSWQLIELLDKINKEGTTVIMATHNFDIVNSLRRRVIKLNKGRVMADEEGGHY